MPTDHIEIECSVTGTSEADFSLLTTVPDGAFSFDDTPVVPQQVYIYRARRYQAASGTYSAYSPLVYARGPWPNLPGDRTLRQATGIKTKLGIGLQDPAVAEDVPVMATRLLKVKSHNFAIELDNPDVEVLAAITADEESVPGVSKVTGAFKVTASPEGISELLTARYGPPATTVVGAVVGPPSVGAYKDQLWKDTIADQIPVTFPQLKGGKVFVHPGGRVSDLSISVDKTQNTPVEIDFSVMALNELVYATEAAAALDTAGFDPLPGFGSTQALCSIAGSVSSEARAITIKSTPTLEEEQVLDAHRGPEGHTKGKSENTGTLTLLFKTLAAMNVYFGQLDSVALPYGATKNIFTVPIVLLLESQVNAGNFKNQIEITMPKCSYKKHGAPVEGPNGITQQVEIKAYQDIVTGTSILWRVRNSQSNASIVTPATAITAVPLNDVTTYTV